MACTLTNPNVSSTVNAISNDQEVIVAKWKTTKDIDYGTLRAATWARLRPLINTAGGANILPVLGEMNFNSYDVIGGIINSDIYLHISPEEASRYVILPQGARPENPTISMFDTDADS